MGRRTDRILPETMRAPMGWPWPGIIRELENFIERSVIVSKGLALRAPLGEIQKSTAKSTESDSLERFDREHIIRVLQESGGVVTTAATRLALHRTTLNGLMLRLGISRKDF